MPLSWNEIKTRAVAFSNEWKNEESEDAEAKSFWNDFFNVFGISRRRVATFEQQVKVPHTASPSPKDKMQTSSPSQTVKMQTASPSPSERVGVRSGYINLLWKGVILIGHKSRNKGSACSCSNFLNLNLQ